MFREIAPTQVENRGITMTVVQAAKRDDAGLAGLDPRLIAEPGREPAWGGLAIDHTILGARRRPIESRHISLNPFSVLLTLRVAEGAPRPLALLVMPMSGGHALMMRDLAAGLLETHDVALLDWNVPYAVTTSPVDCCRRQGDIERYAVVFCGERLQVGADLVGDIAGSCGAVRAGYDDIDIVMLHQVATRIVDNQGMRNTALGKFPCSQL